MRLSDELWAKLKEYKRRRECPNTYCKPKHETVDALRTPGDTNIKRDFGELKSVGIGGSVREESTNLVRRSAQEPRLSFNLMATLGNLFRRLSFGEHEANICKR